MSDTRAAACAIATLVGLLVVVPGWSQVANGNHRVATIVRTDSQLTIDGRLDEPAWQTAPVIADFTQKQPDEGGPSSELTEVRLLYNQEFLYFSVT